MYAAPPEPTELVRLTLQGVPTHNLDALKDVVIALCEPYGDLVFLAPMLRGHSGWMSDQWHATYRVRKGAETRYPPALVEILGKPVIVDVPGQRRFCRHCMDTVHSKTNCRQGQRLRNRQQQLQKQQQQQQQQQDQQQHQSQDQEIPHPDQSRQEDAFGSGYTAPPKRPNPTATDDDAASTTTRDREAPENWDRMDMETPDMSQPQSQDLLQNALQVVELASRIPDSVDRETLTRAERYIQAASAQEGRQGDQ
jgi:hypothetical protein